MWLVQVDLPWACFGFEVTDDGWIIEAAPVAAWTVGRRGRAVVTYYRERSGRVSWQQVPSRLRYAGHPLTGSVEELYAAIDQLDADTVPESYHQKVLASRKQHRNGHRQLSGFEEYGEHPYHIRGRASGRSHELGLDELGLDELGLGRDSGDCCSNRSYQYSDRCGGRVDYASSF